MNSDIGRLRNPRWPDCSGKETQFVTSSFRGFVLCVLICDVMFIVFVVVFRCMRVSCLRIQSGKLGQALWRIFCLGHGHGYDCQSPVHACLRVFSSLCPCLRAIVSPFGDVPMCLCLCGCVSVSCAALRWLAASLREGHPIGTSAELPPRRSGRWSPRGGAFFARARPLIDSERGREGERGWQRERVGGMEGKREGGRATHARYLKTYLATQLPSHLAIIYTWTYNIYVHM